MQTIIRLKGTLQKLADATFEFFLCLIKVGFEWN